VPIIPPSDADAFRADSRARWEGAAAGWAAARAAMQADAQVVSHRMVDAIHPQPGHTVLELAAGPGDTGFLAAELIRPGGKLVCTDTADTMLDVARARAAELGLDNVEFELMDAEWIDRSAATFDAVLMRWGLMLLADPEACLQEIRRTLKPGGRVALATWAAAEANPWSMGRILVRIGVVPASPQGAPGPFALPDPAELGELLWSTGFEDVEVEPVDFAFHAPSADAWWEQQRHLSPSLAAATAGLAPAEHYALRDAIDAELAAFTAADGTITIPARALVAAAGA
jgi:SAM-dependent methyltransferase